MYADDTVLIAESSESLQLILNKLYEYTKEWNLTVNIDKTKILVFRNNGILRNDEHWLYNDSQIEVVNEFNYLGMIFRFNGKFLKTQKKLAEQGRKSVFALNGSLQKLQLNTDTQLSLFDTYVSSILNYSAEVWKFHKALDIENVHLIFCKIVLGVMKSCTNNFVYNEIGRYPLMIN